MLQLDAGTVTTARFIMGNNDNGTASLFTINGGKLAVTGNAGFNVGTNIGHADLVMNGGTVSVPTGFVYIGYGNNSAGTLSMSGTSQFLDSAATGAVTPSVYVGYDAAGQSGSTGLMTMTDNASFTLNGGNETAAGVAFNVAGGAGAGTNTTGILTMAGSSTITISDTSSASHQLMIAYGNGSMKNVSGSVSLTDYASIVNTGTSSGPAFFYCGYGDVNGGGSMTLSGHSTWTQQSTAGNGRFFVGYDVNATDNTTGYLRVGDHASINCPVTNEGSYLGYNGGTGSLVLTASGSFSMSGSGGDFVLGQMGGTATGAGTATLHASEGILDMSQGGAANSSSFSLTNFSNGFRVGDSNNTGAEKLPHPVGYVTMGGLSTITLMGTDLHVGGYNGNGGATGYFTMSGSSTFTSNSYANIGDYSGGGTISGASRGYLTLNDYSHFTLAGDLNLGVGNGTAIGAAPASSITVGNADLSGSPTLTVGGWLGIGGQGTAAAPGGHGILTEYSGLVNSTGSFYIGRSGGQGWVYLNGGTLSTVVTYMGEANTSDPTWSTTYAELNVNGGVYKTGYIQAGYGTSNVAVNGVINLNGGTVTASASGEFFRWGNATSTNFHVYVKDGGANFNTNGNNIGFLLPLENSGTGIGAVTKMGLGNLTLEGVNTYTGPTDIQAGQLTLANATPFMGATTNTITVETGAAIAGGAPAGGGDYAPAAANNTNVVFRNNSALTVQLGPNTASDLQVADLHADGRILVQFAITPTSFLTPPTMTGVEVFAAATVSKAPTAFVVPYASLGLTNVTVNYSAGTATLNISDATGRTYVGFTGHKTWTYNDPDSGNTNWCDAGYNLIPYPNGVNNVAWFNASSGTASSNFVTLDTSVKLNSMLFNAPSDRAITPGYSILKDVAGDTITLSCVGSSISSQTLIQVLAGTNSIAPDIIMTSTPSIYVASGAKLTLSGA